MRIAYLMNGVIGGLGSKNYEASKSDIRKKIIEYTSKTHHFINNDVEIDYFIFSWEPELENIYQQFYSPKKIKCVPQIIFDVPDHFKNPNSIPTIINGIEETNAETGIDNYPRIQAHYSRWDGTLEVSKMCQKYSLENNINYDLVVNARLDLCFQNKINFNNFETTKFHSSRPVNLPSYGWPRNNELIDHIFLSDPQNMFRFMTLYNYLNDYTKPGQCPSWKSISSHFLSVWHLNKIGLLNKETISDSHLTCWDNGYNSDTDYYIFRYKETENELPIP